MNNKILEVSHLSKHFIIQKNIFSKKSIIHAVKDISFDLYKGESLGLIGESGCGKSTTANLLLKLLEPSEGKIKLFDKDITHLSEEQMQSYRKDIQVIFQHSGSILDPKMTMEELIIEPLRLHKIVSEENMEEEVDRLLKLVGLSPAEKHKFPSQLSGGQNQRIIIARAISTKAKLIICDEPVSALDISVQGQILNLLQELRKELDLSYLFISHDIKVIRHMCHRIAVMYKGQIVEINDTEKIIREPRDEYSKVLIESVL